MNISEIARHEAYLRIYNIITGIIKADDEYLRLERQLVAELISEWRTSYNKALDEIFKSIPENISESAMEIILSGLQKALGKKFANSSKIRYGMQKYIRQAYEKAKREFKVDAHFNLADSRAVEILSKNNCYWLGRRYNEHISEKVTNLTREAIVNGLGRKELSEALKNTLGGDYKYYDVVASAALVRSRSFGCIAGMEEAGIAQYEVLAMQDERMCPICGGLHGKVFSVANAREKIKKVLAIDDPEKFKEALPWEVKNVKKAADDVKLPPFHGRCRCSIIKAGDIVLSSNNNDEKATIIAKVEDTKREILDSEQQYNLLESEMENALMSHDIARYEEIIKLREDLEQKIQNLENDLKIIKGEAAEKGIIFASGLSHTLDQTDVDAIVKLVEKAPIEVRKLWNLYEADMQVMDIAVEPDKSFYSSLDRGIHINIIHDIMEYDDVPKYTTTFHELGHLIDNAVGNFSYFYSTESSYNLYNSLRSEVNNYIDDTLKRLKNEAIRFGDDPELYTIDIAHYFIEKELKTLPKNLTGLISDVFSGVTLNKICDSWKHETEYWEQDPNLLCHEFFAETFSSLIVNADAIETMKRYTPKSYEIFKKILSDMVR